MGIEAGTAMLLSTLFSGGAAAVQGQKSRAAQKRVDSQKLASEKELSRTKRIRDSQDIEQQRLATAAADRLTKAKGRQVSGSALEQKGIEKRPLASFADISKAVLDEGDA